jgi:3-deoxy-7-phosphoheptulonate synthase
MKEKYGLSESAKNNLVKHKSELEDIFTWKDDRKILIIGPCSADFEESLYEYSEFLSGLQKKVEDKIKIVMRFYTWKPRTVWGWKGLQNSVPWDKPDLSSGIENSRRIAINIIKKYNIPLADELLHPQLVNYFDDIFSYFAVWARSTENQFHREVISGLDIPVWMKNPSSGDIWIMCNSIKAWQTPSTYVIWKKIYSTIWNNLTHWILRWGSFWPNYSLKNIEQSFELTKNINNPALIIDCNHSNSWKKWEKQVSIMEEVIGNIQWNKLEKFVKWFMIESYLYDWRQDFENIDTVKKWLSLTDPCVGKEWTIKLVESLYEKL